MYLCSTFKITWDRVCLNLTSSNTFSANGRTNKTNGGGLVSSSQTVGSLLRFPGKVVLGWAGLGWAEARLGFKLWLNSSI
jgi:hypothetical protein